MLSGVYEGLREVFHDRVCLVSGQMIYVRSQDLSKNFAIIRTFETNLVIYSPNDAGPNAGMSRDYIVRDASQIIQLCSPDFFEVLVKAIASLVDYWNERCS